MSKKLYISNLSRDVGGDDLEEIFSEIGEVRLARVIREKKSKQSKGFGYVEMSTEEEADEAIAKLNNLELLGKVIGVEKAKQGR